MISDKCGIHIGPERTHTRKLSVSKYIYRIYGEKKYKATTVTQTANAIVHATHTHTHYKYIIQLQYIAYCCCIPFA